jgi:hypothetical protein
LLGGMPISRMVSKIVRATAASSTVSAQYSNSSSSSRLARALSPSLGGAPAARMEPKTTSIALAVSSASATGDPRSRARACRRLCMLSAMAQLGKWRPFIYPSGRSLVSEMSAVQNW